MSKLFIFLVFILVLVGMSFLAKKPNGELHSQTTTAKLWEVQSIDTVKYSRDVAREKANDKNFYEVIEAQVSQIAGTGATHIAIGTPYDDEFIPFLSRWVGAARKYKLKIWFRGNLSGWEGWFGYKKISRDEHIKLTSEFVLSNGQLFEDGDIFSACPECENGGTGDPRTSGDVFGYRRFLIDEYRVTNDAFRRVGKNVRSNFIPMNGDVARLIMDKETTKALGGIVVIDHYVKDPIQLSKDIKEISVKSGGKVVLGEFGAPIPDIHGKLNEGAQARWVESAMFALYDINELLGLNYWVSFGGSTKLWNDDNSEREAVMVVRKFFRPSILSGRVVDELGRPVPSADIVLGSRDVLTQKDGSYNIAYISDINQVITVNKEGYIKNEVGIEGSNISEIVLAREKKDLVFRLKEYLYRLTKHRI